VPPASDSEGREHTNAADFEGKIKKCRRSNVFDFTDRVVMVTGAAGNLGTAVARAFQASGARLVLVDRAPDRLPQIFPELANSPDHFLATSVNLTDAEAVAAMVAEALQRLGRIDVLVNVAGGYRGGTPVHETSLEAWDFLLDLNARTVFITSRAVIPTMLPQGSGKIVNVAARAALSGSANTAIYSVSKSAVVRLTESMAAELKKQGINVNCVLPGTIDTPQNRASMPKADTSRWVTPEALADVILFLASDAARAVHGAAVPVYGTG
jgi:NAD(P)-dependent dehydrogenase (short-subunit alcohol dehydrogenase family)